nr:hypothetical protein MACL_00002476 [Theileria orientalis]
MVKKSIGLEAMKRDGVEDLSGSGGIKRNFDDGWLGIKKNRQEN